MKILKRFANDLKKLLINILIFIGFYIGMYLGLGTLLYVLGTILKLIIPIKFLHPIFLLPYEGQFALGCTVLFGCMIISGVVVLAFWFYKYLNKVWKEEMRPNE